MDPGEMRIYWRHRKPGKMFSYIQRTLTAKDTPSLGSSKCVQLQGNSISPG